MNDSNRELALQQSSHEPFKLLASFDSKCADIGDAMGVSGCSEAPQQEVASPPFHKVTPFRGAHRGRTYPALENELTDSPETHLASQATEDMAVLRPPLRPL